MLDPYVEVQRLLRAADLELQNRKLAVHPLVPVAVASSRLRDALEILRRLP